jgi:carboxypeptidase Q
MSLRHLVTAVSIAIAFSAIAEQPDLQMVTRIRQEGLRNSKVMEYARVLTDECGARLTGSPNMRKANEWTRDKLTEIGLSGARLEAWEFGRGWVSDAISVRMISPDSLQLYAAPYAWSPSTAGVVTGKVIKAKLESKEDLEKHRGKLEGAIVLIGEPREMKPQDKPALNRYDEKDLANLSGYSIPAPRDNTRMSAFAQRREFRSLLAQFTMDEKIAAIVQSGNGEGGVFRVQSAGTWRSDEPAGVATIGLAPEHFARISRLIDSGKDVELEIDMRNRFLDEDRNAWNTVAEIPGSDRKGEIVLLGGHLDSWHNGTGATDNAAGVAIMMEAVRIIKALGVTPKRTIRIALWAGEEQGLLGSRAYVARHVAKRSEPKDPEQAKLPVSQRTERGELLLGQEHSKISAYFNLDNGTGRIRGIYAQENAAVAPIFKAWLEPLHDLGATTVTMRNTSSTDHIPFDEVGVPGFQFIQDQVEYFSRTHHTNWDTYERLQQEDLMQAAVVVATFAWEAANRPQLLPRKPLPK